MKLYRAVYGETYMMEEKYLICEDSLEGIFTGIYEAYALREGHEHVHIQIGEEENFRLFAVYLHIFRYVCHLQKNGAPEQTEA